MTRCPPGRGSEVLEWLCGQGLTPRTPAVVRPSEAEDFFTCPFLYLLRHRFGIRTPYEGGNALELGSCFHAHLASLLSTGSTALFAPEAIRLRADLAAQGVTDEAMVASSVATLEESFEKSRCWLENAWGRCPLPSQYTPLATELLLQSTVGAGSLTAPGACRLDALLYDASRGELWILDAKTCSVGPIVRMSTCPWEFQTHFNRLVTEACLPAIIAQWGLPPDTRLVGFIHYVVQKPSILLLKKDGKTGRAGIEGYKERAADWYAARGQFLDNAPAFALDPPVNLSYYRFPMEPSHEFSHKLHQVLVAATRPAYPEAFPRSSTFIRDSYSTSADGLHRLAPFYAEDSFHLWPDMVRSGRFRLSFRDADAPPVPIPPAPFNTGILPHVPNVHPSPSN